MFGVWNHLIARGELIMSERTDTRGARKFLGCRWSRETDSCAVKNSDFSQPAPFVCVGDCCVLNKRSCRGRGAHARKFAREAGHTHPKKMCKYRKDKSLTHKTPDGKCCVACSYTCGIAPLLLSAATVVLLSPTAFLSATKTCGFNVFTRPSCCISFVVPPQGSTMGNVPPSEAIAPSHTESVRMCGRDLSEALHIARQRTDPLADT